MMSNAGGELIALLVEVFSTEMIIFEQHYYILLA